MMATDKIEELKVLSAEFEWLFTDEVGAVLKQLKNYLQACLQKFTPYKKNTPLSKGNNFPLSLPNSEVVKGFIKIAGDSIAAAELKFKFPKFPNAGITTFIFEQCPWKLQQLQDCCNHLRIALDEIKENETLDFLNQKPHVEKLFNKLMVSLSCAKTSLLVPEKKFLSDLLRINSQKVLNPALPEELLVSFHIHCDRVVFSAFLFNILTTPSSQKQQQQIEQNSIGSVFEHENRWFEVTNRVEIICAVSWLKDIISWINTSQQLCQQLQDKFKMFNNYPSVRREKHVVDR